jgi:hypothetical protein
MESEASRRLDAWRLLIAAAYALRTTWFRGIPKITFAPGVKDEMGTKKLFKSMLGKVYTVRGFDKYGLIELEPKRLSTVWIEEFLKLRARKRKGGR